MGLIPTQKRKPIDDIGKLTLFLHGRPKIGKSSFVAGFDDVLFMATEPGLNNLEVAEVVVDKWKTLLDALNELRKMENFGGYKMIAIDTVDNLYQMCSEYVCEEQGVKHESDLPYGKGWAMVKAEFQRVILKITQSGLGLVMISHSQQVEEDVKGYGKITRTTSTLPTKAARIAMGLVDVIGYIDFQKSKDKEGEFTRVLRTKPNVYHDAGDRTGELPDPLPLDSAIFIHEYREAKKREREKVEAKRAAMKLKQATPAKQTPPPAKPPETSKQAAPEPAKEAAKTPSGQPPKPKA